MGQGKSFWVRQKKWWQEYPPPTKAFSSKKVFRCFLNSDLNCIWCLEMGLIKLYSNLEVYSLLLIAPICLAVSKCSLAQFCLGV